MSAGNPLWGAPRIHGELAKLGIDVSQATVAKYMARRQRPPSQTWRTFLANHVHQIVAADFFVMPTATYRLLFVLVILAYDRRRIVHVAVTAHPTAVLRANSRTETRGDDGREQSTAEAISSSEWSLHLPAAGRPRSTLSGFVVM
jgi:hypothetical protein